jgi:thioredoxin-related protein
VCAGLNFQAAHIVNSSWPFKRRTDHQRITAEALSGGIQMHRKFLSVLGLSLAIALFIFQLSVARVEAQSTLAPDFTGSDTKGQSHKLSNYRGKYVVLEWTNSGCPYTIRHYKSGNMQALQKEWTAKGVIWLSIISSAPGLQGYMTAADENAYLTRVHASPTAVLLDPQGSIGRLYGARTTPHMFVIDPSGKLIYQGAIDANATADPDDSNFTKNYVSAALTESMAGKPVTISNTRAYGCSVKYSSSR